MYAIKETIVVEGKYDKNALSQILDAHIIETAGFSIFSDKEKLALFRRMAEKTGVIILTDSDSAGFLIRNYLKGALPKKGVKHAYIPDIFGKERRKRKASCEGKLGVEAMDKAIILDALKKAGATISEKTAMEPEGRTLTKADLFAVGLSGAADSGKKRQTLLSALDLPSRLRANGMLEVLNTLYSYETLTALLAQLFLHEGGEDDRNEGNGGGIVR